MPEDEDLGKRPSCGEDFVQDPSALEGQRICYYCGRNIDVKETDASNEAIRVSGLIRMELRLEN